MNYFIDCHAFDEGGQGTVSYIRGLYGSLIKIMPKDNFYFAANDVDNLKNKIGLAHNVFYVRYKSRNKYRRLLIEIPLLTNNYYIDIIHCQYYLPFLRKSKEIVTIHDVLFLDFIELFPLSYRIKNYFMFLISIYRADVILTVSEYSKKRIQNHYNFIHKNINVIGNGVYFQSKIIDQNNINQFEKKYLHKKYILYVSRIEKRKNHINLCKAFLMSKTSINHNLVLIGRKDVGSSEFYDYLNMLCLKDKQKIQIYNDIADEDLLHFYQNASLFVFPSKCEGFGIPPLEAAIMGLSTICAYNSALMDFYFFGDRFFDPTNIVMITTKIDAYVNNCVGMEEIKQLIKNKYSWDTIAKQYKSILLENFYAAK